jgi:putative acetyltransferase
LLPEPFAKFPDDKLVLSDYIPGAANMPELTTAVKQLIIRPEKAKDLTAVRTILTSAFHGSDDADLVERLRGSSAYVPELALVADFGGEIRGYIICTHIKLHDTTAYGEHRAIGLGPIAVAPAHQQAGIGSQLIENAIAIADRRGDGLIVLLGHESYYQRFGFKPASRFGVLPPRPWPDSNYMVRTLSSYDATMRGTVEYPPQWRI